MKAILSAGLLLAATTIYAQTEAPAPPPAPTATDAPVMMINGEPLTAIEVDVAVQMLAARAMQMGGTIDEKAVVDTAVEQVVASKLLAQEAKRRKLEPDSALVGSMMDDVVTRAGGKDKVGAAFGVPDLSYDRALEMMLEGDLVRQLIESHVATGISIDDEEVKQYYQANTAQFEQKEEIHARHVIFRSAAEDSDDAKAAARAKAEKARERAVAGEDFATLADELSEGPGKGRGGDLGYFSADRMVPEFSRVAFALEIGDISEVVETLYGFHVIKVEDKRAARTRTLDEVSEQIRTMLTQQEVGKATDALLSTLQASAEIVQLTGSAPAESSGS